MISARLGVDERLTRGLALMVPERLRTDQEVYEDLQHEVLVWDGQRSPVRDVPEMLAEVRRVVAEEADVQDGA